MSTTTNRFEQRLNASGSGIRAERSAIVKKQAESAQAKFLTKLNDELLVLEDTRMKLEDINVDSELTTKVVAEGFDANTWILKLNAIEMEIENKKVEITVAEQVQTRWFTPILLEEEATA